MRLKARVLMVRLLPWALSCLSVACASSEAENARDAGSGGQGDTRAPGQADANVDARADAHAGDAESLAADGSVDASRDAAPDGPIDLATACEAPRGTFGSCSANSGCNEPVSERGKAAIAICIPDLGDTLRDTPCSTWDITGRCYHPEDEYWTYYFSGDTGALMRDCQDQGGVFCPYAPGHDADKRALCVAACEAQAPDYSSEPECESAVPFCVPECEDVVAFRSPECARCLTENMVWPEGGCNDWECQCPSPEWPAPESATCSAACSM
jgi:hypothetical protein